ncbi:hypothetical protein, partial [Hymenobacter terrestris]|uniref:hypothetical protein n=1 Tax=Hymenobacter terrestris TaxID=2748310 RepID=UPI001C40B41E
KCGGVAVIPFRAKRAAKVSSFSLPASKKRKLFFEAFLFSFPAVPFRSKRAAKVEPFLLSASVPKEKVFSFRPSS